MQKFLCASAFVCLTLVCLMRPSDAAVADKSSRRVKATRGPFDLRDQTAFSVLRDFTRQHPKLVHEILVDFVNRIPENQGRSRYMKIMENAYVDTLAMEGPPCSICKALVLIVRVVLELDGYTEFKRNIEEYCEILFNALDHTQQNNGKEMCGIIEYQLPHIAAVIQTISPFSPVSALNTSTVEDICNSMNSCYETPEDVLMEPHSVQNSPESKGREGLRPSRQKRQGRTEIKIAQITDVHIEFDYAVGSNDQCPLYVCCQAYQGEGNAKTYGHYACNIPVRTMELFIDKVIALEPDIIIFSGDVPPHTMWAETLQSQLDCPRNLTATLRAKLADTPFYIPVYPAIGNHEMYPTDMLSVRYVEDTPSMLESFGEMWADLANFTEDQISTMRSGGYYTLVSKYNDLRILSINTEYMYTLNYYNVVNHKRNRTYPDVLYEATTMKKEIEEILEGAKTKMEKVIIINHHPPGSGDYIISESRWYEELVVRFSDIIVLQVAGHTHTDEFRLMKDSNHVVHTMMYVSPSIDTSYSRNPSMRLYRLDSEDYTLLDYEQHYLDIPESGTIPPNITLLYKARDYYRLPDMTAASWETLLKKFQMDDELLMKHRRNSFANALGAPPEACDESCRRDHICRQLHAQYDHYEVCSLGYIEPTTAEAIHSTTLPPLVRPSASAPHAGSVAFLTIIASFVVLWFTQ